MAFTVSTNPNNVEEQEISSLLSLYFCVDQEEVNSKMNIEHNFDMEPILFVNLTEGASMFREIRSFVFVNYQSTKTKPCLKCAHISHIKTGLSKIL